MPRASVRLGCLQLIRLLCAAWLVAGLAPAQEVIRSFHSSIDIAPNGELSVTETIAVTAEGNEIRRGIFRDFPTRFITPEGREGTVSFDVASVLRDGQAEPYRVEQRSGYTRVYIGSENVFLVPGNYTYRIEYTTDRQIRYFEDYDELFWNATGNAWSFPIESASATVYLPPGGQVQDTVAYIGPVGSTTQYGGVTISPDRSTATFTLDTELAPREGLTIGVKLPKGVIPPPTQQEEIGYWLRDHRIEIAGGGGLLLVLTYYWLAWKRVGRDPPQGVIVPRWDLPHDISPAMVQYIEQKRLKHNPWTAISAALMNMGVKGIVALDETGGDLTIDITGKQPEKPLPTGEASLYKSLKTAGRTLTISPANGTTVQKMAGDFRTAIYAEHRNVFYRHNTTYVLLGVFFSAIVLALLFAFSSATGGQPILMLALMVAVFFGGGAVYLGQLRSAHGSMLNKIRSVLALVVLGQVLLTTVGFTILQSFAPTDLVTLAALGTAVVLLNVLFFHLLGAPTPLGREVMDAIEGLRMYINLAEKDRLNLMGPQMSPKHFEAILPYAVALGLEKVWSQQFEAWLASSAAAAAAAGAAAYAYSPGWYHGHSFHTSSVSDSFGGLTSSMQSSFTSSLPVPSSSSSGFSGGGSFGGGGFSGGGGGGGGGGGW